MRSLLIALLLSPLASAQSFDCKLAQSPREKAVCADTRLSALDSEIAANYKSLRAQLSPASAALVESDQREWLHWIDLVCPANGKGAVVRAGIPNISLAKCSTPRSWLLPPVMKTPAPK